MTREDDLQEILDRLLRDRPRTGDRKTDVLEGLREVWERRQRNTVDGGALIDEARALGVSLGQIERETEIPKNTAWRWSTPPTEADPDGG